MIYCGPQHPVSEVWPLGRIDPGSINDKWETNGDGIMRQFFMSYRVGLPDDKYNNLMPQYKSR